MSTQVVNHHFRDSVSVTSEPEVVIVIDELTHSELKQLYAETKVLYDQQTSRLAAEEIRWEIEATKVDNLTNELNELKSSYSKLSENHHNLTLQHTDLTSRFNESSDNYVSLLNEKNHLSNEHANQISMLIAAHKEISIKKNEFDSLNNSYVKLLEDFNISQQENSTANLSILEANEKIIVLERELDDQKTVNNNLEEKLNQTISSNAVEFEAMTAKLNRYIKVEQNRWQQEASKVDGINDTLRMSNEQCAKLEADLHQLQSACDGLQSTLNNTSNKLEKTINDLRNSENNVVNLTNTLNEKNELLTTKANEHSTLLTSHESLQSAHSSLQLQHERAEQAIGNLQQELRNTNHQLDIQRNLNKNLEETLQQTIVSGQNETQAMSTQLNQRLHVEKLRWEVEASRVDEISQNIKENQRIIDAQQKDLDELTVQHKILINEYNSTQQKLTNTINENKTLQVDLAANIKFSAYYEAQFNAKSEAFDKTSALLAKVEEENAQFQIALGINGSNETELLGQLAVAKVQLQEMTAKADDLHHQLTHYDCIPCKDKDILCQQLQQRLSAEELRWEIEATKVDLVTGKMVENDAQRSQMSNELEGFKSEFNELEFELIETQRKFHDLADEMELLKKEKHTLSETLAYSEKQLVEQNTDFKDLLKQYDRLEAEFRNTKTQLLTTTQKLKEKTKQLDETQQLLSTTQVENNEMTRRVEQLIERVRLEVEGNKDTKANYEKIKVKCSDILNRNDTLKIELKRCEDRLLMFEGIPTMEEVKAKFTAMQNDLTNTKKHHNKMESEYDGLQAIIANQQEIINNKETMIIELTNDIKAAQDYVNNKNAIIVGLQEKLNMSLEQQTATSNELQSAKEEIKQLKSQLVDSAETNEAILTSSPPESKAVEGSDAIDVPLVVPEKLHQMAENKDLMGLITELSKIDNDLSNLIFCSQTLVTLVSENSRLCDLLCDLHMDQVLIQTITHHPMNVTIQFNCIQLVALLSSNNVLFCKLIGELGVIYSLLVASKLYVEDESLLYYCCRALSNLCHGNIENSNRFVLYKGIPLLLHNMSRHVESAVIQRQGCVLIFSLCNSGPDVCKALCALGGDIAVINAMISFRQDVLIQQYGFDVLGLMASTGGADYTNRTKKKKVVEVCKYALEVHVSNVELVKTVNKFLAVLSATKHFIAPKTTP